MLQIERHGDVQQLRFTTPYTRSMGFEVSAFAVRGVLIDSGFPDAKRDLGHWLDSNQVDGAIITHYHEDHAGNIQTLAERGVHIRIAAETLDRLKAPPGIGWYRRWCWGSQPPLTVEPQLFAHPALELVHTPGHSTDHHVVWDAERETVFGADLFLGIKVRISHPWPREDVRAQIASLRRVVGLKPKRYFDAHRGLVPDAIAQLSAKAVWLEDTVGRIDQLAARGASDAEILRQALGGEDRLMAWSTLGDFSRLNFVRSVCATSARASTARSATVRSATGRGA